jgi:hypothetical protein
MPFTPLTATHRLNFQYSVLGFTHTVKLYCKRQDPLIGGPALLNRDGTLTDVVDAAQGFWDDIRGNYSDSVAAPGCLFEERSGSLWLPITGVTVAGAGGSSTPPSPASQFTMLIRDTAFKKMRLTLMEMRHGYVGHSPSGLGIYTDLDVIANSYNGVGFGPHDPYMWQKSRGDNYILASGAIAGSTLDLNDKLKRRRGLE